jgi:hypothetical protein
MRALRIGLLSTCAVIVGNGRGRRLLILTGLALAMAGVACGTQDNGSTLLTQLPGQVSFSLALPKTVPNGYTVLSTATSDSAVHVVFGTPRGGTEVFNEHAPGTPLGIARPVTRTVLVGRHEWRLLGDDALVRVLPSGLSISIVPSVDNDPSERSVEFMETLARAVEAGQ